MNKIASIIIPHHNRKDHLQKLLSRISSEFEVIVSSGGTFAENCNRGAKKATTNHFIFCNDDCLPSNEDLQEINNWLWTVDVYHHLSQSSGRYDNDDDNKKLFNKLYNQEKLKQLYENTNYCF
jgi:hypothetical protein